MMEYKIHKALRLAVAAEVSCVLTWEDCESILDDVTDMQKRIDEFENPWKSVKDSPPTKDDFYTVRYKGYRFAWTAYYDTESNEFHATDDGGANPDLWMRLSYSNRDGEGE